MPRPEAAPAERIALLEAEVDRLNAGVDSLRRELSVARAAIRSVEAMVREKDKIIELLKTTIGLERTRAEFAESRIEALTAAPIEAHGDSPGFASSDDLPDTVDATR